MRTNNEDVVATIAYWRRVGELRLALVAHEFAGAFDVIEAAFGLEKMLLSLHAPFRDANNSVYCKGCTDGSEGCGCGEPRWPCPTWTQLRRYQSRLRKGLDVALGTYRTWA